MKQTTILVFILFLFGNCTNKKAKKIIDFEFSNNSCVYEEIINKDTLIVCNLHKVSEDVIDMPLSTFIDSCRITYLETRDSAYVKVGNTIISENFIGIRNYGGIAFKLFDYSGKYIRDIGKIGRGPNEYSTLYCENIDEKNNSICLLPWNSNKILRYDLMGSYLEPIKLKFGLSKAHFFIENDKLTLLNLPFSSNSKIGYTQTINGEIVNECNATFHSLQPDYSNEIFCSNNTVNKEFHLSRFYNRCNDTLYHYDSGIIRPRFSVNFNPNNVPLHNYFELPLHYIAVIKSVKKDKRKTMSANTTEIILIDKKTLKAKRIRLINDYFGDLKMDVDYCFRNGYFINNLSAIDLKNRIKLILQKKVNLTKPDQIYLNDFIKSFDIMDNNIVFWGKLKTS